MKISSGKVIYRKFTAKSGPASIRGNKAVNRIITKIMMLKAIIRYLNFTANTPIITYCSNSKIKIVLRQRLPSVISCLCGGEVA